MWLQYKKTTTFLKIAIVCVVNCTQALFLKFTVQKRLCPLCKFSVVAFLCKAKLNLFRKQTQKTYSRIVTAFLGKDFRNIGCLLSDISFDTPATVIFASLEGNSATRGSSCTPNVAAKFCAKSTLCNKRTPVQGCVFVSF